jgi:hypothetical protein
MTPDNVWAYTTIPSVTEILLLDSVTVAGELLRRDASGAWPEEPLLIGAGDEVVLDSLGFRASLNDFYRTTNLVA